MRSIEPFFIYLVGKDVSTKTSSYVCTFLSQLHLYQRYNPYGSYDRICLLWGENGIYNTACRHPKYKHPLQGSKIPISVKTHDICSLQTESKFLSYFMNIIDTHCIPKLTPIIFFYDGHGMLVNKDVAIGSTTDMNTVGNMVITPYITISDIFITKLFTKYIENPKFFIFSQCGSLDFALRLIPTLSNTVIFTSTIEKNVCSYGASIFSQFQDLMEICRTNKIISFQDVELLVTTNNLSYLSNGLELKLNYFYSLFESFTFIKWNNELNNLLSLLLKYNKEIYNIIPIEKRIYWNKDKFNNILTLFFTIISHASHKNNIKCLTEIYK